MTHYFKETYMKELLGASRDLLDLAKQLRTEDGGVHITISDAIAIVCAARVSSSTMSVAEVIETK